MSQKFSMTPIAHIHSDFAEKFGVPRQSGLVEELEADIVFEPAYQNPDALPGWGATPGWVSLPPAPPSGQTPLLCPA